MRPTVTAGMILLGFLMMTSGPDWAQAQEHGRKDKEQVEKRVELIRMWKLTEALSLDEEKGAKLFPLINTYEKKKKELRKEEFRTMRSLRETLAESKPDEKALKEVLDKLEKGRRELGALKEKEFEKLKKLLTTEELARFIVFQIDFHREIMELIGASKQDGEPHKRRPFRPMPPGDEHP